MKRALRFGAFGAALLVAAVFATLGLVPRNALAASPLAVFVTNFPAIQAVSQSGPWTVGLDSVDAGNVSKLGGLTYDANGNLKVAGGVAATQSGTWTTGLDSTDSGHLAKLDGLSFSGAALNVNVANPPSPQRPAIRRIDLITSDTTLDAVGQYSSAVLDTADCRAMYLAVEYTGSSVGVLLLATDPAGNPIAGIAPVPVTSIPTSVLDFFPLPTGSASSTSNGLAFQWPSVQVQLQNGSLFPVTVHSASLYCMP